MSEPPKTPTALTRAVWADLQSRLRAEPSAEGLAGMLRHLAKWRSELLANTLVQNDGAVVQNGPFKGMRYPVRAAEGARAPRLLGTYEGTLWPVIEDIIDGEYDLVIDVGAAEGYYAVGMARAMPHARVMARDSDPDAQALCRALATENGVASRVEVGGEMAHGDFDICARRRSVVLCDIEGAEAGLLDPLRAPGLLQADILVEVHEGSRSGLVDVLRARFATTHSITRLDRKILPGALPAWADGFSDLDRLLILWEWRASPTPWLWMRRR